MTKDPMKQEREFYDTRELDYSKMRRVELRRVAGAGRPRSTFAIRLDGDIIEQLRQIAKSHRIGPTQLVRQWIIERISAEEAASKRHRTTQPSHPAEDPLKESLRPLVRELLSEELAYRPEPSPRPRRPARRDQGASER